MKKLSDTDAGAFEPWPESQVHLEWGSVGAKLAAERGDAIVVIDILSFSTTMSIAIERGAKVAVFSGDEIDALGGHEAAAARLDAHIVSKKRNDPGAKFTLSPASLDGVESGDRLILTSLNGAAIVAAASGATGSSGLAVVGSLRSASAVADYVAGLIATGTIQRVTLVAAGEHWSSVADDESGVRPAFEDHLGAGAVAAALSHSGLSLSVEARAAVSVFTAASGSRQGFLADCVSGRELIAKGFRRDVELASETDVSTLVPVLGADGFFSGR